jgi:ureidoglycolate hydrolase
MKKLGFVVLFLTCLFSSQAQQQVNYSAGVMVVPMMGLDL